MWSASAGRRTSAAGCCLSKSWPPSGERAPASRQANSRDAVPCLSGPPGRSACPVLPGERPEVVTRLVIAEANLDPGPGPMTGAIIQHSERDYIDRVYAEDVAAQQMRARDSGSPLLGVVLGMYQVSALSAIYRSSQSLGRDRKPTFRELFV